MVDNWYNIAMEIKLNATVANRTENPVVNLRINGINQQLSILEARSFALQVLSAAERAEALVTLYEPIKLMVGKTEADRVVGTLSKILEK